MKTFQTALVAFCALAGASALPHPAGAAMVQRSMLIQACTASAKNIMMLNNCAGYIAGVADTVDAVKDGVCIPKGLSIRLLRVGVTTYLQSHNTGDGPAAPSVLDAMRNLYRCVG